jgi:hypothetical protein
MVHGEDARVVPIPLLSDYPERPQRFICYGVAGGPIAQNSAADEILQHCPGTADVFAEYLGRNARDHPVVVAMAADLVPPCIDLFDQIRMTFCDPAQAEEGTFNRLVRLRLLVHKIEKEVGAPFNPRFIVLPPLARHHGLEGRDHIVVFKVDGKDIGWPAAHGGMWLTGCGLRLRAAWSIVHGRPQVLRQSKR